MTRKVGIAQVAGASALILAAAGCGTARPASPAGSAHVEAVSGPVVGLHSGPGESPAAGIADAVQQAARAHFPSEYAGEVLADHGFKVVVYLTRPTKAAETVITARVQPGVVRFARAPRSLVFLSQLHKRVTAEQPELERRGINLVRGGRTSSPAARTSPCNTSPRPRRPCWTACSALPTSPCPVPPATSSPVDGAAVAKAPRDQTGDAALLNTRSGRECREDGRSGSHDRHPAAGRWRAQAV